MYKSTDFQSAQGFTLGGYYYSIQQVNLEEGEVICHCTDNGESYEFSISDLLSENDLKLD